MSLSPVTCMQPVDIFELEIESGTNFDVSSHCEKDFGPLFLFKLFCLFTIG